MIFKRSPSVKRLTAKKSGKRPQGQQNSFKILPIVISQGTYFKSDHATLPYNWAERTDHTQGGFLLHLRNGRQIPNNDIRKMEAD